MGYNFVADITGLSSFL